MKKQFWGFGIVCFILFSIFSGVSVIRKFPSDFDGSSLAEKSETGLSNVLSVNNSAVTDSSICEAPGLSNWRVPSASEWTKVAMADRDFAELVVGVKGEYSDSVEKLQGIVEGMKGQVDRRILRGSGGESFSVKVPFDSVSNFVDRLSASGFCRYVEPNWKVTADFVPNDPSWDMQWGPQKIQADFAWNTTLGNRSVLVAVIDTGVNYMHPDLAANYVPLGYDWVNNDADPMDDHGHGTHCAGIIAAATNNSIGIAGLAQVRIMAEKGLDAEGTGYDDDLAQAIIHAVDHGARILSLSWGSSSPSELIEDAIHYACNHGVLVIAAAGNEASSHPHYPAAYDDVVAVAATDSDDAPAYFSNYGDWVEVAAPGVSIYSTFSGSYRYLSGTSMACPHTAGVAALILGKYPNMTGIQLRMALRYATDDLGDPGFDVHYGYGRINARKAMEALPVNCDLILWNWSKPLFVEPDNLGLINGTVYNFGMKALDGVTVQLLANGSRVSEQTIPHLGSGCFGRVTLPWVPHSEGAYKLTVWIVPAQDEADLTFNAISGYIHVGIPIRTAVLDSSGTAYAEYAKKAWDKLNNEWDSYGNTLIYIDYSSLFKGNVTLQGIEGTRADVLLLPSAWLREYSDEEIEAITQYVQAGHGFIITGLTFSSNTVPNNNKLVPLFGLSQREYWNSTRANDTLIPLEPEHPLFNRVQFPFNLSNLYISTCVPKDNVWDSDELWGGTYLAKGQNGWASIVAYRGLVYFSVDLENVGFWDPSIPMDESLQLLYNAMTWSRFQRPQHDLVASVKAPAFLLPAETARINATVSNLGFSDESNVAVQIAVNGSTIHSETVPLLHGDSSFTISYPWSTTQVGMRNVSVYVTPAAEEDNLWNNEAFIHINILIPPDILLVADNDEYESGTYRTSLPELRAALDRCGAEYAVWEEKTKGSPPLNLLTHVKLVFWTVGGAGDIIKIKDNDASNLVTCMKRGGKVFIDGDLVLERHMNNEQFLSYVLHCYWVHEFAHPQLLCGTEGLGPTVRNHPVTFGLPEEIRWETLPETVEGVMPAYGGVNVMNYLDNFEPPPGPPPTPVPGDGWEWILPDKPVISWNAMVVSEKNGKGSTVFCPFPLFALPETARTRIVMNSLRWLLPEQHELAAAFVPLKDGFQGQNQEGYVNISIGNWGFSNESGIEAQLMINDVLVDIHSIAFLQSNSVCDYTYTWLPPLAGEYNITLSVSAITDDYWDNNWMSQIVKVRHLVVLLISEHHHELESIMPVLDSINVGYHSYYFNGYYNCRYSTDPNLLSNHAAVIWAKSNREMKQTEHDVINQYVNSGGNLLVTDTPLIHNVTSDDWYAGGYIGPSNVDSLMADILRVTCTGANYLNDPEDRILCPDDPSHPIMDGLYGTFPVGHNLTGMGSCYENTTATASRNAVLIAHWISPKFGLRYRYGYPAHKVVSTKVGTSKVVYWGGQGQVEWMQSEECGAIFKNLITWFEYGEFHDLKITADVPTLTEPGERVQIKVKAYNVGYQNEPAFNVHLIIDGSEAALFPISSLQKRSNRTVTYNWTPLQTKTYNITAWLPLFPQEINAKNNVCSHLRDVHILPHIAIATPTSIDFEEQFSVNITIRNSSSVTGWQMELYYRSYALNITSISEGTFLSSVGLTSFQVLYANDRYNATHGRLRLACSLANPDQRADGSGILVTLTVRSVGRGICQLTLSNTHLTASNNQECTHRVEGYRLVVGVLGDINGDNHVDILDVVRITAIYGVSRGDVLYAGDSDINGDGTITILDLVLCTANYGKSKL